MNRSELGLMALFAHPDDESYRAGGFLTLLAQSGVSVFIVTATRGEAGFFHSTTCQTCIDMMGIVAQVYPEFTSQVGLVNVNVYESRNDSLLRRVRISNIPTQVFVNRKGEAKTLIGVMQPDELRAELKSLAAGASNGN